MRITVRNNNYQVDIDNPSEKTILRSFIEHFTTYDMVYNYKLKRNVRKILGVYGGYKRDFTQMSMPYGTLSTLLQHMQINRFDRSKVKVVFNKKISDVDVDVRLNDNFNLYDYQKEYREEVLKEGSNAKIIELHTGAGKGIIAMSILEKLKSRTVILVINRYMNKWKDELIEKTNLESSDIRMIIGSKTVEKLIHDGTKNRITESVIIVAMRTMANYVKAFETGELNKDFVKPRDFMKHIGAGVLVNDETHQEFCSLFKLVSYFDSKLFLCMSATLRNKQANINKLYYMLLPNDARIRNIIDYVPFNIVKNIGYRFKDMSGIKSDGAKGYSHILYEQTIIKNRTILDNYLGMILSLVRDEHMPRIEDGDKCLIFCSTVVMCTVMTRVLTNTYPELTIGRYVEDDEEDNLLTSDICVSTVLSSGTAYDIPGLRTVIQTISLDSVAGNLQAFGRLRDLSKADKDTVFIFSHCTDIPKHRKYNTNRIGLFRPRSKKFIVEEYRKLL